MTVLVGPDATERRLCEAAATGELGRFGYLHFATHALMNNRVPLSSALVLSAEDPWDAFALAVQGEEVYDGLVTADQILRTWRIGARLVTLSACETGLGKESRGEGFVGFSQAFFVAGARSLLVSLWKVEDRATMLLMTRFYENTLGTHGDLRVVGTDSFPPESPLPMAEALREAKEWVRGLTWDDLQAMDVQPQGVASRGLVPVEEPVVKEGDHPFAHPHFWAAFVLSGDPR